MLLRRSVQFLSIFALLGALTTTPVEAGMGGFGSDVGGGKYGSGGGGESGMAVYTPNTVTQLQGTVSSSSVDHNSEMGQKGLHVYLSTDKGRVKVHVAPEWVTKQQRISFRNGEPISVIGATFEKRGDLNIYAATIYQGRRMISLRNPQTGQSLWRGRHAQGGMGGQQQRGYGQGGQQQRRYGPGNMPQQGGQQRFGPPQGNGPWNR
ncbi:MAG: hypothetical protein HQL53_03210 [Magnetococcales bacterium]|nr:hypothetical protein [Magnetococcales bacterium]